MLVIRAVHIRLIGAQTSGTPAYLKHTAQLLMPRSGESGLVTEGISGESPIYILDHQRLGSCLHFQLHISPCTPPQGGEKTIISPISQYLILVPDKPLIRQLIPMPLAIQRIRFSGRFFFLPIKGFRITDTNLGLLSLAEGQGEIPRCQVIIIQKQADLRIRRDCQGFWPVRKSLRAFDPFRPAELGQTLDPAVHRRYRARNQQPSRVISRSFRGTLHAPYGLLPFPVVVIRLFPAPRISGGFQFLTRAGHVIPQDLPFGPRSVRLITQADPSGIRIYDRLLPRIAL